MRRRDLLGGLSLVPLAAPAVAQCVVATFPRINLADRCESDGNPPSLDLSFMTPGTLDPRITFTRASTGTYFDAAGVMQTAAINAPRWDYVGGALRGLLLEDQRTNSVRNSTAAGAVPGTPGTPPTNWAFGGSPAVTPQIVGTGTESGIPYVDIRFAGTTINTSILLLPETTTAIAAATGQAWSSSLYLRLVAGTLSGITQVQVWTNETTAAGAAIKSNTSPALPVTTAPLASQRNVYSVALTGGGTVGAAHQRIYFNTGNGVAIDATFRIGAPQMELGDFATSYIPTSTVAVTRSIDSCLIQPANMSSWFTGSPGGSWFAEFDYFDTTPSNSRVIGRPDTAGGVSPLLLNATRNVAQNDGVTLVTANATTANAITKACSTWAAGSSRICANGGAVASSASLATGYGAFTAAGLRLLSVGAALGTDNTSGHIRAVRYWPGVLSDAQMQAMTV